MGTCLINWTAEMLLLHDSGCRLFSSEIILFILTKYAQICVTKSQCENIRFLANIYLFIEKSLICLTMRDAMYTLSFYFLHNAYTNDCSSSFSLAPDSCSSQEGPRVSQRAASTTDLLHDSGNIDLLTT